MERPTKNHSKLIDLNRFAEKIVCSSIDRPQCVLALLLTSDNDHLGANVLQQNVAQYGETFVDAVRMRRQAEVQGHDGGPLLQENFKAAPPVSSQKYLVVLSERPLQLRRQTLIVIDD